MRDKHGAGAELLKAVKKAVTGAPKPKQTKKPAHQSRSFIWAPRATKGSLGGKAPNDIVPYIDYRHRENLVSIVKTGLEYLMNLTAMTTTDENP